MTIRSKQWYTKTSRLEYSFAKSSIGRRSSDRFLTTRSSVRRPVESKFQISLASFRDRASQLASEIRKDLPELTVHDLTHLDALWEIAATIAGDAYSITP